jgi:hypothetical protein
MPQITLTFPDGSEKSLEGGITSLDISKSISDFSSFYLN